MSENWSQLGFKYFTIHNVGLNDWCVKYDLVPFTGKCGECESNMAVDMPFFGVDGIRGLKAKPCDCGSTCIPFTYTSPELNNLL